MSALGKEVELFIDRLSPNGGRGVARWENLVIFVPDTAPNERVLAQITLVKKNYAEARLLEVLSPSPARRKPLCPVFSQCGGCQWLHLDYSEQLIQKQNFLTHTFRKLQLNHSFPILDIIPAPSEYRYRNRIQVHKQGSQIGFFQKASHKLIPIQDCLIAEKELAKIFPEILKKNTKTQKIMAERFEIYRGTDGDIHTRSSESNSNNSLPFSQVNQAQNITLIHLVQTWLDELLSPPPESANENNKVSKTLKLLETEGITERNLNFPPPPPKKLLDLYCGSGNFTIPLANKFQNLSFVGVELNPKAIQAAEEQLGKLNLSNLEFIAEDVEIYLSNLAQLTKSSPLTEPTNSEGLVEDSPKDLPKDLPDDLEEPSPSPVCPITLNSNLQQSLVLIDPPRAGCKSQVTDQLLALQPSYILYISCNMATLKRDLEKLSKNYQILKIQGVDMFPQTDHLEVVSLLISSTLSASRGSI